MRFFKVTDKYRKAGGRRERKVEGRGKRRELPTDLGWKRRWRLLLLP